LLKSVYLFKRGRREFVAFTRLMLDARYLTLDIQDCTGNEIRTIQYPETSIQDQSILAMVFIMTTKF
jgi:hypothetical protein